MGTKPAPSYADNFMARKIDWHKSMWKEAGSQVYLKDFLMIFFSIFQGTSNDLHKLFDEMNQLHRSIKFTMNHTSSPAEAVENRCKCKRQFSVPFLDVFCSIQEGKIETDLFRKDTDRNMYLLPSSCHPPSCTKNIPFSLC